MVLAPKARFLHIATHGWFAPETLVSMRDRVEEQEDLSSSISRAEETLRGFAPETLCGLALAVLSACKTSVDLRRAGQGIQSLQGALHAAGVRTAITSQWKVDDAATRRLMELFYTSHWDEGLGQAETLWRAKMALRADGHGPSDWAGWVSTGDPD